MHLNFIFLYIKKKCVIAVSDVHQQQSPNPCLDAL